MQSAFLRRIAIALPLVAGALMLTTAASAAGNSPNKPNDGACYDDKQAQSGDQTVKFCDDPMQAAGLGPMGDTLVVRPTAARMNLLRPRTQFVPEMLKSVENI
jgi:hypothetical protein